MSGHGRIWEMFRKISAMIRINLTGRTCWIAVSLWTHCTVFTKYLYAFVTSKHSCEMATNFWWRITTANTVVRPNHHPWPPKAPYYSPSPSSAFGLARYGGQAASTPLIQSTLLLSFTARPSPSRRRCVPASQSLLEVASASRLGGLRVASRQTRVVPQIETPGALLARTACCFLGGSFESGLHSFDFNFLIHAVFQNFAAARSPDERSEMREPSRISVRSSGLRLLIRPTLALSCDAASLQQNRYRGGQLAFFL